MVELEGEGRSELSSDLCLRLMKDIYELTFRKFNCFAPFKIVSALICLLNLVIANALGLGHKFKLHIGLQDQLHVVSGLLLTDDVL